MAKGKRKTSKYAAKAKRRMRYSQLYRDWRSAILNGDISEADRLSELHREKFANA